MEFCTRFCFRESASFRSITVILACDRTFAPMFFLTADPALSTYWLAYLGMEQGSMDLTAVRNIREGASWMETVQASLGFRTHTSCTSYTRSCKAGIVSTRCALSFLLIFFDSLSIFFLDESH